MLQMPATLRITGPLIVALGFAGYSPAGADDSLQGKIGAAEAKGTVAVSAGTYQETVKIDTALTLKGENPETCVLEVTDDSPAISIATKDPVTIEGLTIRWQLATSDGKQGPACAILAKDARVTLKNCRIVAAGNGQRCPAALSIAGFSKVTVENCRFDGFEFTINCGDGAEGTIVDSVVVNPGHCGISVFSGSKLEVSRCIVTGSKFHGLRSTGGTLIAHDNLIVNNKNRGVYLGNKSAHGKLSNNVIQGNATGISAFAGSDVAIENNVIVGNSYAGLDSRDTCPIVVKDNVFTNNTRGFVLFAESGKNEVSLGRNDFWKNETTVENIDLPEGSLQVDPQFVAADLGDFSARATELAHGGMGLSEAGAVRELWKKWQAIAATSDPGG
jgi:nitrous oxidase accessory protein NosD